VGVRLPLSVSCELCGECATGRCGRWLGRNANKLDSRDIKTDNLIDDGDGNRFVIRGGLRFDGVMFEAESDPEDIRGYLFGRRDSGAGGVVSSVVFVRQVDIVQSGDRWSWRRCGFFRTDQRSGGMMRRRVTK